MDAKFLQTQILPGDEDYKYDKRVDFESNATSEWDSDEFWEWTTVFS